jgi:hypothetical protein
VTNSTADRLGVELGFIEGRILAAREKELLEVRSPGSTETMALFDFRTVLLRGDEHVCVTLRYASLVDPQNGKIATAYWVLEPASDAGSLRFVGDSLRVLPANHVMDWEMHVDGGTIRFGKPRWDTFAATRLPDGVELRAATEFKNAAAGGSYTAAAAAALEGRLRQLLDGGPRFDTASAKDRTVR